MAYAITPRAPVNQEKSDELLGVVLIPAVQVIDLVF